MPPFLMTRTAMSTGTGGTAGTGRDRRGIVPAGFKTACGHQALDLFSMASRTGYGLVTSKNEALEVLLAFGAPVFIYGHFKSPLFLH